MSNLELIHALEAAVNATPDNLALRKHLAEVLVTEGMYAEAVQQYRRALDLAPTDGDLKLALAGAYQGQGKADVALVVLEDLMRSTNPPARALIMAARLYLQEGQCHEAARVYQQAIAKDPGLADPDLAGKIGEPADQPIVESGSEAKQTVTQDDSDAPEEPADTEDKEKDRVFVVGTDKPDASAYYEIERPKVKFADVGGMEKVKEEIRMKIIYPLSHPELFQAYGKPVGGGILMYGPPGCGKTYLARATAGEVQASFMSIGLHDVLDMYIGQSERNVHEVFDLARKKAPCVLFFDEVDALGGSRAELRQSYMRQVINQMLSEMDGVDSNNEGVLILAATNTPWYVDQALRRPGRFDRVLFVPPPDLPAREAILRLLLKGKPAISIDIAKLAREANNFSGADLKGAIDVAVEKKLSESMRDGRPHPLTTSNLLEAIQNQRPTTQDWFETARNYAVYSNEGGLYDAILDYLKLPRGRRV